MKTPKEKAQELVGKFKLYVDSSRINKSDNQPEINAKQCAIIAVDEMIVQNGELYLQPFYAGLNDYYLEKNSYLFKVKQEINNL